MCLYHIVPYQKSVSKIDLPYQKSVYKIWVSYQKISLNGRNPVSKISISYQKSVSNWSKIETKNWRKKSLN